MSLINRAWNSTCRTTLALFALVASLTLATSAELHAAPGILTLVPADTANINALPDVQVTFDESVTGVAASDLTVEGSAATSVTGSGAGPYVFSGYTGPADGAVNVALGSGAIINGALEAFAGANWTYTLDSTQPTCTVVGPGALTSVSPIDFTINFSKSVNGFADTAITVTGGSKGTLTGTGSGPYIMPITPSSDGVVSVQVDAGAATDDFGNLSVVSNLETTTFDSTAPTVFSQTPASSANINALPDVQVTFDESVTGIAAGDLTVNGSAATGISGSGAGPYTFSGFTAPVDGTVTIVLSSGGTTDDALNPFAGDTWNYTQDSVAPTPTVTTPSSPTNIDPISFTINFDENVTGIGTGGFTVNGGTIDTLSGSGSGPYTLNVIPSGQGTVTCEVNAGAATDDFSNANVASNTGSVIFDSVAPTVQSIVRVDTDPTNATSVNFTVTFDEDVTGVDSTNFTPVGSGVTGTVSAVSGSGTTWNVTVSPVSGSGTLRIDLDANLSAITDLTGNALTAAFTAGESYSIDQTPPTVASINRADADPTNAASVDYTVTFSEPVSGVGTTNFSAVGAGVTGTVSAVAGSGDTYTVTVSSIGGTGTLRLDLDQNLSGITDAVGNPAGTSFTTGESYTVDRDPPTVSSITATDTNPTSATVVNYEVVFSEPVTGVTSANFSVAGAGVTGVVSAVTGAGTTWTVTIDPVAGDGTIALNLDQNLTSIIDALSNPLVAALNGDTYTIDQTAPVVTSIVRADTDPTSATSVNFIVTFAEPVTGVDASNFTPAGVGVSGSTGSVSGSGTTWNVIVKLVSGDGTMRLDLDQNLSNITDAVGNPMATAFTTGESYSVDQTAPTIVSISRANSNPTNAATLNFTLVFSEPVSGLAASNLALAASGVTGSLGLISGSGTTWTVVVNGVAGTGTLGLDLANGTGIIDAAGNEVSNAPFTGEVYDVDQTAPTIQSIVRLDTDPTSATTVNFALHFSEPVTGLLSSNLALGGSGVTGTIGSPVDVDGTTWTVAVTVVSGTGTLGVDLTSVAGIQDTQGNTLLNLLAGEQYTVDQTQPAISSILATDANPTSSTAVNYLVTFTEKVSGVTSSSFSLTLAGVTGTIGDPTTLNGITWNVPITSVTGDGTLRLDLTDSTGIEDAVGNPLSGTPFPGDVYTIDQTAPFVVSILRSGASPTNATSLGFTVKFSEAVTTVTAANLALTGGGVVGSITSITTADQITWNVTVTGVTGSGTLGLDLVDGTGTTDAAFNPLTGLPFTGELYTVDQTGPVAQSLLRADTNPTSAPVLHFVLTFSKPVIGVTSSSLTLTGAGVTGTLADPITTDSLTWFITVSGVTGDGTLGVDLFDTTGIQDFQGNALGAGATGELYDVDQTAPAVVSITRADVNPTSATVLNFTVQFTEAVSGVTSGSFTLSGAGVTGSIGNPSTTDSITWSVAVSAVAGTGTLGLDLSIPAGIADIVYNPLTATVTGPLYNVDQTNPVAASLTRADTNPTSATSVNYVMTFSESVTGLTSASLSLNGSGTAGTIQDPTTTDGITWNIPVTGVTGTGTLAVDLTTTAGIVDVVGNPLIDGILGEIYTVDQTPPVVISFTRIDPNPNAGPVVRFAVAFSEPVTSLSLSNLGTSVTGTATGSLASVVDISSSTVFQITLTGVGGTGNLGIGLANSIGIYDLVGNPLTVLAFQNDYYDITPCTAPGQASNPVPAHTSVAPSTTAQLSWTSATGAVSYNVTFDGSPIGVTSSTSIAISTPLAAGIHTWQVDADSGCGLVTNGPLWRFTVLDAVTGPGQPTDGARLCSSPGRLEWNAAAGAVQYNVFIDNQFVISVFGVTYYDVTVPLSPGPHIWRVDAVNINNAIVPGPEWQFVVLANGLINPAVWRTDGQVYAVATGPGVVYIAGNFTYVLSPDNSTWKQRSYIAAIDAATGVPTDFDPKANAPVHALALSGSTLYAGGQFTTMGGLARQHLAATDVSTSGAVLNWDPKANGLVRALFVDSTRLYAGGDFTQVKSQSRAYLAAFDITTTTGADAPTTWAPAVSNNVYAIAGEGSDVYIGGIFQSAGGQPLRGVAALDSTSGLAHVWPNGAADLYVYALAVKNGRLYCGGQFNSMAGQSRLNLACLDPSAGALFGWNPIADRSVYALLIDGNTVFAGGNFVQIGTEEHLRLAGMHMITGATVPCNYSCNNIVRALGNSNNTLYAGGDFTQVGTSSALGFAALGPLGAPASSVHDWSLYEK